MLIVAENFQRKMQQMMAVKVAEKRTTTLITVHFIVDFAKNPVISLTIV
jgi:hypothetical protein